MPDTPMINDVLHPSEKEALAAWARLVRENREQVERFREAPERPDFYAPTASVFKVDPHRSGEFALDILLDLARPEETWLDIGCGGGRYALPLALKVHEVIGIEPSAAMCSALREGMKEYSISNIRVIDGRWPVKDPPQADVALISHVGYDIEDIGPFLDAMEKSARRLCVAIFLDRAPSSTAHQFWPAIHGENRIPLPALSEFLGLQLARRRLCEVRLAPQEAQSFPETKRLLSFLRQQLFIEPEGEKDRRLIQLIPTLSHNPGTLGIVSWTPPASLPY